MVIRMDVEPGSAPPIVVSRLKPELDTLNDVTDAPICTRIFLESVESIGA